jgi:bifunctional non-homologous end joining protein LigD
MCAVALKRSPRSRRRFALRGAKPAPYPGFITPCDPTLRERAPEGSDWLHEIKIDGYRAQLHIHAGRVRVFSRSGYDWTEQFSQLARAAEALSTRELIIDGEATVVGTTGLPDFQALRRELAKKHTDRLIYMAFDLLYLDGRDLRGLPLIERKRALQELLAKAPAKISYADFVELQDGETVFRHACELGMEGIVSKRRDAPYRSGRQETWIKLKCTKSDTFPIVAFVEKLGARPRKIASLYVGRRDGERVLYAGKAGTGYTEKVARELREKLDPLIVRTSPLAVPVKKPKATWVKPIVDAEIEYGALTDDGLLREAVFKGLRDDLALPAVHTPARSGRGGVPRENILQLLPDAVAPSKDELAAYWRKVAKRALPYLGRRPLKLVRHTRGTIFYHKGALPPIPESVHQLRIENDIEHPDLLVFDLDPGAGVAWEFVIESTLRLRKLLQDEGLDSWPKTTGGKGLHLMVPIDRDISHDAARLYCKRLAQRLEATDPARYTTSSAPARRNKRIYIDYLRNGRGTTAIGAYSPRAREGFPVAAPVTWAQVERGIRPDAFTIARPPRATPRRKET